jgi:hypothetical protein
MDMTRVLLLLLLAIVVGATPAVKQPSRFFVQLIYASNSERPDEKSWVKIGPKLRGELSPVFRWKHYWQVTHTEVPVTPGSASKARLADERELEIGFQPDGRLRLIMYHNQKMVRKLKNMSPTERIIMGGNKTSADAWFVVVRPDKPSTE